MTNWKDSLPLQIYDSISLEGFTIFHSIEKGKHLWMDAEVWGRVHRVQKIPFQLFDIEQIGCWQVLILYLSVSNVAIASTLVKEEAR